VSTYWVSALAAGDGNNGTSYALAKKTISAGLGLLSTGDTLHIVNDGSHQMLSVAEVAAGQPGNIDGDLRCRGTSWSSFGFHIKGVDPSGNPALATVVAVPGGTPRVSGLVAIRDRPAFCIIEGLLFDWTAIVSDSSNRYVVGATNLVASPWRFRNCVVLGSTFGGVKPLGSRRLLHRISGTDYTTLTNGTEVYNCLFINAPQVVTLVDDAYHPNIIHHNVFIEQTDEASAFGCLWGGSDNLVGSINALQLYHNTFHEISTFAGAKVEAKYSALTASRNGISVHSNLLYLQPSASVSAATPIDNYIFNNRSVYDGTGTRGTMGYNVFALGTNFPPLGGVGAGCGFYDDVFAVASSTVASTQVYATDNVVTNATPASLYNGTTTSWTWLTDDGYNIDLPFDARPTILRTSAFSGAVPGAIQTAINFPPVAVADTYSMTAGNTLAVPAPGVQVNDTNLPVGDTMTSSLVTNVAIGTLSLSSDGGFNYTPPITFAGTVTFTYKDIDSYLAESNVMTVTITVDPYPVPPDDVDEDISYGNLVDTLPFFRPVLKADLSAMVRVHRNTNRNHVDLRHYLKDRIHWESSHRVCEVSAGARKVLTLGGVHRAAGLILETDTTVNATVVHYNGVTDVDFGVTVRDCLLVDKANVRRVIINNTSSSTATVHMAVYD